MEVEQLLLRTAVRNAVKQCTSCGLHEIASAPVPFSGPSPSPIAVVGEAPGRMEDIAGEPFVGPSGQLLRSLLADAGFQTESLAFVNSVCCFPDRTPTGSEVNACRPNLHAQLTVIQPRYIIAVGGVAVSALHPAAPRMGDVRGNWFRATRVGLSEHPWAIATWHPAAILRNGNLKGDAEEDFLYARLVIEDDEVRMEGQRATFCLKCGDPNVDYKDDLPWCQKHTPKI